MVFKYRLYSLHEGVGFSYILLTAQEVHVYMVAMIALRHALARERKTYARLIYHACDHMLFSINCITARLNGAPLISAYGAGPPKVIWPREGHAGK